MLLRIVWAAAERYAFCRWGRLKAFGECRLPSLRDLRFLDGGSEEELNG